MNCHEFWDRLPQPGHDLTEAQAAHLAACAPCAAQWTPHRALAAGLHSVAGEWRQMEAPPRVEAGLMAAFRVQTGYQVQRSFARSWWTPVVAWAGAAAATIAMAVALVRGYQPPPARPGTVAAPHRTAQPVVQAALAVDSDDDTSSLGEGFVRLPNAPRIEPNEDYNVVRVEVPGSAMIEAGISLGEDRAAETVLADVALAADGTPRAVRLVPDGGTY